MIRSRSEEGRTAKRAGLPEYGLDGEGVLLFFQASVSLSLDRDDGLSSVALEYLRPKYHGNQDDHRALDLPPPRGGGSQVGAQPRRLP